MVRKVIGPRQVCSVSTFDGIPLADVFQEAFRISVRASGRSPRAIRFHLWLRTQVCLWEPHDLAAFPDPQVLLMLESLARMVPVGWGPHHRAA